MLNVIPTSAMTPPERAIQGQKRVNPNLWKSSPFPRTNKNIPPLYSYIKKLN